MANDSNVSPLKKAVEFTIDGRSYKTEDRKQPASELLKLAGLDPTIYDLGELKGERPKPVRFADDEIVHIHPGSRFVSIRQRADVA